MYRLVVPCNPAPQTGSSQSDETVWIPPTREELEIAAVRRRASERDAVRVLGIALHD